MWTCVGTYRYRYRGVPGGIFYVEHQRPFPSESDRFPAKSDSSRRWLFVGVFPVVYCMMLHAQPPNAQRLRIVVVMPMRLDVPANLARAPPQITTLQGVLIPIPATLVRPVVPLKCPLPNLPPGLEFVRLAPLPCPILDLRPRCPLSSPCRMTRLTLTLQTVPGSRIRIKLSLIFFGPAFRARFHWLK